MIRCCGCPAPDDIVEEVGVVEDAGLGEGDRRDDHGQLHRPRVHHLGITKPNIEASLPEIRKRKAPTAI